jgi:hypothetical protein
MRRALPLFLLAALAWPACACTLPTFRVALEQWEPDPYQAVVFSHGALPADSPLSKALQENPSNLRVALVDVDKPANPDALKIWRAQGEPALPWMAVSFPRAKTPAWSGTPDAAALGTLLDSPSRKNLRNELLSGASGVWVLLESGDAARDDKIAGVLQTRSAELVKQLKIPEPGPEESRSSLPLKVAFSVVRVSRTAPEEKFFVAQLLQPELNPDKIETAQPLVFPVFGRGRALPAMTEMEALPELLADASRFITGACACDAKDSTPGVNLLIALDWETALTTGRNQRNFVGTFDWFSEGSEKPSPDVVGSFIANGTEKKPGRKYLVKMEKENKVILATLQSHDGKIAQLAGRLDDFGPDGEAKYLIVSYVIVAAPTKPVLERRGPGGI